MSDELENEVRQLREEIEGLRAHKFLKVYDSIPKFMAFNFLRGVMVALGGVIGATVVLSMLVWSLSQIEFIPIVGDWARQIAEIVQAE